MEDLKVELEQIIKDCQELPIFISNVTFTNKILKLIVKLRNDNTTI